MIQTRTHFGIGLVIGIVVTALFFQFFAPRYDVVESRIQNFNPEETISHKEMMNKYVK